MKHYILYSKGTNQSANLWDFLVFWSKFIKLLSIFKQQYGFSSNFASFFSFMRHNFSVLLQRKFYMLSAKGAYQSTNWWNFTWEVESLKFSTLSGSFCPNHIKFQLKKYRTVISHDSEEWCKVWRKTDLWFQTWHQEFGESSPNHWRFYFDGLFLSKVYEVWAKKI